MRTEAEASCLPLFEGVVASDLGYAFPGTNGTPVLAASYRDGPDTLEIDIIHAPSNQPGLLIGSDHTAYLPFLGGTLVPGLQLLFLISTSPSGTFHASAPIAASYPTGITVYAQAWFLDPLVAW